MGKPLKKKRGVITQSNKPIAALDTKGAIANNSISVSPTLPPKPVAVEALGTPLGVNSSSFDNTIDRYNQSDRMLNTGRQGFAETYARYADPATPPVISSTPYITGPQINRDTGEITQNPLTWMLTGDDMANLKPPKPVEPVNPVNPVDPPEPPVGPIGPIDPINQVEPPNYDRYADTPMVRYDIENAKPTDYEIETPEGYGWGTPLGDFRFYEHPGMTEPPAENRPGVGPVPLPSGDRDGERPLVFKDPVVIRHPKPLQGERTTTDGDTTIIENTTPFKGPYKQTDGSFQEIAGSVLGGIESMADAILGKTQFDQYPRPESEKFVARKAGKLNDLMKGYGAEMFEWWETQGVPAALTDRTPFGPDYAHSLKNLGKIIENKDNIKTQEYGQAQFLAILNTANMIAAVGPAAAIPPAVVILSKEIMAGLKNSLADHPELRGNPIQDVIHGSTWVLGQTLEKAYNATLGNLTGKIDDAKLKEKLSKLNISEMMKTPKVPTGVKITIDPNKPKVDHLKPQNDPFDLGTTEQKLVSGTPVTASREMRKPQPVEAGETATADVVRVGKPVTDTVGSPFVGQGVPAGGFTTEASGSLFKGKPEVSEAKTLFGPLGTRPPEPLPEDDRLTGSQLDEGIDIEQGTVETDDVTELVDLMLGEVPTEGKFDPDYVNPDKVDPNAKREKTEGKFTEEEKKEQQKQQEELDRKQEDAEYIDKLAGEVTTPSIGKPVRAFKGDVGKLVYDKDTQRPQPTVKDDREEFKGQPVTSKVEGEVVGEGIAEDSIGRDADKLRELEQEQEEREKGMGNAEAGMPEAEDAFERGEIDAETMLKIRQQVGLERRQNDYKENGNFKDDATNEAFSKGAYNWLEHGTDDYEAEVDTDLLADNQNIATIEGAMLKVNYQYDQLEETVQNSAEYGGWGIQTFQQKVNQDAALREVKRDRDAALEGYNQQIRDIQANNAMGAGVEKFTTQSAVGIYLNNPNITPEEAVEQAQAQAAGAADKLYDESRQSAEIKASNFWHDITEQVSGQIFNISQQQRDAKSASNTAETAQREEDFKASQAVTQAIKDKSDARRAKSQADAKKFTEEMRAYYEKLAETEPLLGAKGSADLAKLGVTGKILYSGDDGGLVKVKNKDGKVISFAYVDPDTKGAIDQKMEGWVSESELKQYIDSRNVIVPDPSTAYPTRIPSP
tara:strand:+ start:237 stop:3788 length:3552 start_codon:yes stop_codon:yes gene_type:complete